MKRTVRYSKDANLNIRVDRADLSRWKRMASKRKTTLTSLVIAALNSMVGEHGTRAAS